MSLYHLILYATLFLFCLAVVYGGICDARSYTIPNEVSYGLIALFVVYGWAITFLRPQLPHLQFEVPEVAWNVIYGLIMFIFFLVFWKLKWVGGGDVKFVSAISLFMGLDNIAIFAILLAVISIVFLMVLKGLAIWNPFYMGSKWPAFLKNMVHKLQDRAIPYGVPAAISALALIPKVLTSVY